MIKYPISQEGYDSTPKNTTKLCQSPKLTILKSPESRVKVNLDNLNNDYSLIDDKSEDNLQLNNNNNNITDGIEVDFDEIRGIELKDNN